MDLSETCPTDAAQILSAVAQNLEEDSKQWERCSDRNVENIMPVCRRLYTHDYSPVPVNDRQCLIIEMQNSLSCTLPPRLLYAGSK